MTKFLQSASKMPSLIDRLKRSSGITARGWSTLSLKERVAQQLQARTSPTQCLLLDCSSSMDEDCGNGQRKIDALKEIVCEFPCTRQFSFGSTCVECAPTKASGSTNMAEAFYTIKTHKIEHCVLITDGLPNSEEAALREAAGLTIDILYVGPPPPPAFLGRLAKATGGQYGVSNLIKRQEITQQVTLLLAHAG